MQAPQQEQQYSNEGVRLSVHTSARKCQPKSLAALGFAIASVQTKDLLTPSYRVIIELRAANQTSSWLLVLYPEKDPQISFIWIWNDDIRMRFDYRSMKR